MNSSLQIQRLPNAQRDIIDAVAFAMERQIDVLISPELACKTNFRQTFDPYSNKKVNNNISYGYYPNTYICTLIEILDYYNIKSLFDLGCGMGLLLKVINIFRKNINLGGVDINNTCIDLITRLIFSDSFRKCDIFNLTNHEIKDYECLYFWDPFCKIEEIRRFIKFFSSLKLKGKYIIIRQFHISVQIQEGIHDGSIENLDYLGTYSMYMILKGK